MAILHLGILLYISPVYGLFHHYFIVTFVFVLICFWMLYIWLLWYVCVLHTIRSLVTLHIWELCHEYFLYIICHYVVFILVDLHSKKWISTLLFESVFTCIKTHIFDPGVSISHIIISIIQFFCCLLFLWKIVTFHIQHSKIFNHNLYTFFEKIFSFSGFPLDMRGSNVWH